MSPPIVTLDSRVENPRRARDEYGVPRIPRIPPVNDLRFAQVPKILETPKGHDNRGTDLDKVNLKRLRGLIKER
jgi:hypothetical protein